MITDLSRIVERIAATHALVIGDAMLDSYLRGRSTRLCREAPAPVVDVDGRTDAPGGAANAAASLRALGARTSFLSAVGTDDSARRLGDALAAAGVDFDGALRIGERETLSKERVVVDPQLMLRLDRGTTAPLSAEAERELIRRLRPRYLAADVVVISDYGYGVMTDGVLEAIGALQRNAPRPLVVDSKHLERYRTVGATAVKPNYPEAEALLGPRGLPPGPRIEGVVARAPELLARTGAEHVVVTADVEGAVLIERDGTWYRTYARPAPHSRAAGAGDTFTAALALGLGAGASAPVAMEIASAAAQVVVTRDGTTTCSSDELRAAFVREEKTLRREDLPAVVNAHRRAGRRIVFTNGCFDIVHRGHVTYLSQAKAQGDVLFVAVNSDASVRRLKGPERPMNPFDDRAQVLAALSCVDHVVWFDEDTPEALLRIVAPDVVVKGGDYSRESLPETPLIEALGGEVCILPYIEGVSTTRLIQQIRTTQEAS